MTAKTRLFGPIGPGLRAVHRSADGRTYVLASPSPGLVVYDAKGKQLFTVAESAATPGAKPSTSGITFGEDCDIDSEGRTYIADRGSNMVDIIGPDGTFANSFAAPGPVSIAWLGDGEIAVATLARRASRHRLRKTRPRNARLRRSRTNLRSRRPEPLPQRRRTRNRRRAPPLLRISATCPSRPSASSTATATAVGSDVQYVAVEAASQAQAIRREIVKQEKSPKAPSFKRILTGFGVDPITGEIWMAVGNTLMHFDKDGNRRASYQMYTPEGARLEANTILIEPDRMIIGGDPIGIYEFSAP